MGPAIEVFPRSSNVAGPEIITAPGEINLNGKIIEKMVIIAPIVVKRNSDHKPRFCAVTLWAISCVKKDTVIMAAKAEKTITELPDQKVLNPNDNPTPITIKVAMDRCFSSVGLK